MPDHSEPANDIDVAAVPKPQRDSERIRTRLEAAMEEVVEAIAAGQACDREALLAKYHDVAAELTDCLSSLDFVQNVAPRLAVNAGAGSSDETILGVSRRETLGDFAILREIGRGGMGVVYEAEQRSLGRRVALKVLPFAAVLDRKQLQRFKNEAQAAAALHHNHIVPVFSVGCERGVHYYAMQYIEGHTLAQLINQIDHESSVMETDKNSHAEQEPAQTMSIAALTTQWSGGSPEYFRGVARVGVQVAEAVHYAHEEGIVHRDIKPGNILVDHRGHVWITDFGLAQVHGDGNLTITGDLLGTLRYMSPEQAAGKRLLDHRTDVYSLGVTLYEMATLEAPFSADNRQELLRQVTDDQPRRPRHYTSLIPADLETIVLKAMSKEPEGRYQTAQDLADDLQRFVDRKPIQARRVRRTDRLWWWIRRHPISATAIVIIALLVSILAVGGPVVAVKYANLAAKEVAARRSAEESRRNLQEVLDRALTRTATALKSMGALQRQLSEDTLTYYEGLLERRGSEPDIRFETAVAYTRLGWAYYLCGQDAKALELYETALDLLTDLASQFPSVKQYRFELAEALLFVADEGGREDAPKRYARAIDLAKSLVAASPYEPTYRRTLGYTQLYYGNHWRSLGRFREADRLLNQSVTTWRAAVQRCGEQNENLAGLAYTLYWFGRLHMECRRFDASLRRMEEAFDITNRLDEYLRQSPETVGGLTGCYAFHGRLLCCLHRPKEAESFFREANSAANVCLKDFPEFRVGRANLADTHAELGVALEVLGHEQEAEEALRTSLEQWRRLIDSFPANSYFRGRSSWAQFRLGQLLWRRGRQSESHTESRESLRRLEQLMVEKPEYRYGNHLLAYVLATCYDAGLCDTERAVKCAEAAISAEAPNSWQLLGWTYCRAERWERALRAIETSNELSQGGDAFNWLLLAMIHFQLGQQDEAIRWHTRAADATERKEPVYFCDVVGPFELRDLREEVGTLMEGSAQ